MGDEKLTVYFAIGTNAECLKGIFIDYLIYFYIFFDTQHI